MAQQRAAQANEQETVEESRTYVLGPDRSTIPLRADEDGSVVVDFALEGALSPSVTTDSISPCPARTSAGPASVGSNDLAFFDHKPQGTPSSAKSQ